MHVFLYTCKSFIHGLSLLIVAAIQHVTRYRKLRRRVLQFFLLTFLLWSTADVLHVHRHLNDEQTHVDYKPPGRQRIYIASIFWNNERTLSRHWNDAVVELASVFGSDNIFVSVYESGSSDGTKYALHELDKALDEIGVQRDIMLSDTTPQDDVPITLAGHDWIEDPLGEKELRSIPNLSRLRNMSLRPLHDLRSAGTFFDRILFLSDIVFTKDDVLSLLGTNYGTYTAACSLDVTKPPLYYDTFALRDSDGHELVMQKWPFFRSSQSRIAVQSMLPVPLRSCWSGMVFMPTDQFYSTPPLQFRGVPDSLADAHIVASECCLIHMDNILSKRKGVYLNPYVRLGYGTAAYSAVRPTSQWLSTWEIFESLWENRLRRWFTFPILERWSLRRGVAAWEAQDERNHERGEFCLTVEVPTLVPDAVRT